MNNPIQRTFIVGDNWLYYKIYAGSKTSDLVLQEIIEPLTKSLLDSGIIDKWFFIRYSDPKPHLRIRFSCPDSNDVSIVISSLLPTLKEHIDQDLIWKIQMDTYNRELERYGKNTIEISETLFFYDSILIINLLKINGNNEEGRWQLALLIIDNLLNNFEFSTDEKLSLMERLKASFGAEFGMNKNLNKQIDFKYRKYRSVIEKILPLKSEEIPEYSEIHILLQDFNTRISFIAKTLIKMKDSNSLMVNINSLLSSYIHMSMVRLFKSNNRLHEMVIYDFLFRYYKSRSARDLNQKLLQVKKI